MNLRAILSAVACFALAACTSAGARTEPFTFSDCEGKEHTLPLTTINSPDPWADCVNLVRYLGGTNWQVAMMVLGGPLACAIPNNARTWGIVILPLWAPQWMIDHEVAHIRGEQHLLPFSIGVGCYG